VSRPKQKYNNAAQQVSEEQLLSYLEGNLSPDQQHQIEEVLLDDPFLNDAVEGLAAIKDKEQIGRITAQLNLHLRRQIKEKKALRRQRRKFNPDRQTWMYILVILLLAVLSWAVIKKML